MLPDLILTCNGCKQALHDPHDIVEENPIGQSEVAVTSILGNGVHVDVLAVEWDTNLHLHHLLKEMNLRANHNSKKETVYNVALSVQV